MPQTETGAQPRAQRTVDEALRLTAERAARCGFFFDFDGVLAPIRDDPDEVYPEPGAIEAISGLSRHIDRVVIVSARPVEFLRSRFPDLPQVTLYGLYGLETQRHGGRVETDSRALPYLDVMAGLVGRARAELPAGALIEYKRLSVALHYRTAPELGGFVEEWSAARAAELGLWAQGGRMVVELKPPVQRDKGDVVGEEINGLTCAWYFGDDLSDIKAFKALDAREAVDPTFAGVRVAVANPETGRTVAGAADLELTSPADLPALVQQITGHLTGG